jgi:transcriptional regulator ATRX
MYAEHAVIKEESSPDGWGIKAEGAPNLQSFSIHTFAMGSSITRSFEAWMTSKNVNLSDHIVESLMEHQCDAIQFAWDSVAADNDTDVTGVVLAHHQGLGKTLTTLSIMSMFWESYPQGKHRMLVVAPKTCIVSWIDEFERWELSSKGRMIHCTKLGSVGDDTISWVNTKNSILLMSCDIFSSTFQNIDVQSNDPRTCVLKVAARVIQKNAFLAVLDEAHVAKSDRAKIHVGWMHLQTKRRVLLTGTPIQNNMHELWSVTNLVDPDKGTVLGARTESDFIELYAKPIAIGMMSTATSEEKAIMRRRMYVVEKLTEHVIHRRSDAVLAAELKDIKKYEFSVYLDLPPLLSEAYRAYLDAVNSSSQRKHFFADRQNLMAIVDRPDDFLKTVCAVHESEITSSDSVFCDALSIRSMNQDARSSLIDILSASSGIDTPKTVACASLVSAILGRGEKVVVMSESLMTLSSVRSYIMKNVKGVFDKVLTGNVSNDERYAIVNDMNSGESNVLFMSKAGTHGVTVTGANNIILLDQSFNPVYERQAIGRVYRKGQTKNVCVYKLCYFGTMEYWIMIRALKKIDMFKRIIDRQHIQLMPDLLAQLATSLPLSNENKRSPSILYTLVESPKKNRTDATSIRQDICEMHGFVDSALEVLLDDAENSSVLYVDDTDSYYVPDQSMNFTHTEKVEAMDLMMERIGPDTRAKTRILRKLADLRDAAIPLGKKARVMW